MASLQEFRCEKQFPFWVPQHGSVYTSRHPFDPVSLTKSHTAEARTVLRARIMLACLEGEEMQQVARELRVSVPSVSQWRQRFALWGVEGCATGRGRASRSGMMLLSATGC
jgi:hypothetical protein